MSMSNLRLIDGHALMQDALAQLRANAATASMLCASAEATERLMDELTAALRYALDHVPESPARVAASGVLRRAERAGWRAEVARRVREHKQHSEEVTS